MAQDSKVFDVASPGKSKPETGSKPMVVGHKIMQDPSVITSESEEKPAEIISSRSKKTITPPSEAKAKETLSEKEKNSTPETTGSVIASDEKSEETTKEEPVETAEEATTAVTPAETPTAEEPAPEAPEQTPEEKQKSEDSLEVEREDKLQEMIKSKEYYAPIQEASFASIKTFFKTFTIVALVGIIALVVLIDMEIVDVGLTLPFDFL